jgi:hypothetical protein
MLTVLLLVVGLAVGYGIWRKFTAIQWIWLMTGLALAMLVLWAIMLVFVVGPGMQRMGPPGAGMPPR